MIAPTTIALLIMALPTTHAHVLHDDPISVATDSAIAFAAILVAIYLVLRKYGRG